MQSSGPPVEVVVAARRYRCLSCGAVMLVVPTEMDARLLYSRAAVAMALVLLAEGVAIADIRARVSPWRPAGADVVHHWTTLGRWVRMAREGLLFRGIRGPPHATTLRRAAAHVAAQLVGRSPSSSRSEPPFSRAFRAIAQGI